MDMRQTLIDQATQLVRRSGYAGFSYADLSAVVGIRKASIHHHFATKEDLGLGMVEAYGETFKVELATISAKSATAIERLADYAALYRSAVKSGSGCLCGVLAAEFVMLPQAVQRAVKQFFDDNVQWLEGVLAAGRLRGEVGGDTANAKQARMLLATLQGAVLLARVSGDVATFDDAVAAALEPLR